MALAGVLELQLVADVARLRQDMERMNGIVSRSAKQMESALDNVRGTMMGLFSGASVAGFGMWIKGAIDFQDQLNDLNKTTGISVEKLGGLALMSKQTGSDLTGIAQSINKLTLEMGKAPEKFAKIGITAKDPIEAFKQLSEIFRNIEDPQLRAAVAAEALGKGWASAAPALSEGAKAIDEMIKKGQALVGSTQAGSLAADEFNDRFSELQMAIQGTSIKIANDMLPLLTELVSSLTDVTDKTNQSDSGFSVLTETMRALVVFAGNVAFAIRGVAIEIGGIMAQMNAINFDWSTLGNPGAMAASAISGMAGGGYEKFRAVGEAMREDAEANRVAFDAWEKRMMSAGGPKTDADRELDREMRRMRERAAAGRGGPGKNALRGFVDGKDGGKAAAAAAKKALEEQTKRDLDALEEEARIMAEVNELLNEQQKQRARQITEGDKMVEAIEFEAAALGMTNLEREKAIALRDAERLGIDKSSAAYAELKTRIEAAVENREKNRESRQLADDLHGDMKGALQRAFEDSKNPAKAFVEAFASTLYSRVSSRLADALTNAVLGAPGSGGSGSLLNAVMGGAGGFFGGGTVNPNVSGADLAMFYHSGGVVGSEASFSRPVSTSVFHGAPRFHSGGIAGDEVPIIAQRGEGVFTPAQMRALGGGGGQTITVNQNFTVGDVATREQVREEVKLSEKRLQAGVRRAQSHGRG